MKTAWIFPGQGSQYVGMGRDLYEHQPAAREVFDLADHILGFDLTRLCFEGPEAELMATENAQPALLTTSIATLRVLHAHADVEVLPDVLVPHAVAGHSLGEYSALVAGGSLDLETALRLVRRRGELMAAAHEGTMAAVIGLDELTLDHVCRQVQAELGAMVVIANYNTPDQLVISGAAHAVEQASVLARQHGARRVFPLRVSAAFHSPLMAAAAQKMRQILHAAPLNDLRIPLIGNVNAAPVQRANEVRSELEAQIDAPVRWTASVHSMAARGIQTFVEIGPGRVLSGLVKRIVPAARQITLGTLAEIEAIRASRNGHGTQGLPVPNGTSNASEPNGTHAPPSINGTPPVAQEVSQAHT